MATDDSRMFYRPDQVGLTKVAAAIATLRHINPDVICQGHSYNITKLHVFDHFLQQYEPSSNQNPSEYSTRRLSSGGVDSAPVDLVLGCVDNFEARIAINQACLEVSPNISYNIFNHTPMLNPM